MYTIDNIQSLRSFVEQDEYVIRDIVECTAYDALYFNLIGLYKSLNCYSEDPEVISYVLSVS